MYILTADILSRKCLFKICVTNRNGDSWGYFQCKSVYWLVAVCHFQLHVGDESLCNDAAPCCWPKGNANINFLSCWCSKIDLSCHIMAVKNHCYTQAHIHWEIDRNMERSLIDFVLQPLQRLQAGESKGTAASFQHKSWCENLTRGVDHAPLSFCLSLSNGGVRERHAGWRRK